MPTTFTTSFPVARGCTGTKRVVGSDPHKIMPFLSILVRKWPREAIFVAHCLSGSGGVAPYSLIPPGRVFHILKSAGVALTARNGNAWIATVTQALGDLAHLGGIP